jgi:hypothetical protein
MTKKMTLPMLAIGAMLALAIPTSAGASSIDMPFGFFVPVGTSLTAISLNTETETPLGTVKCANVSLPAEVVENSATSFKLDGFSSGPGEGTASLCRLGTTPIQVTHVTLKQLSSSVSGYGVATLSFVADLPGELRCSYFSSAGGTPITYVSGASSLHLAGELLASPEICGGAGEVLIHGDYSVGTTSGGGGVYFL